MTSSRNNPKERTMMAIPALIVCLIMGSTIIHLAGETLITSLAVSTIPTHKNWSEPSPETPSKRIDEFEFGFDDPIEIYTEETIIPKFIPEQPEVEQRFIPAQAPIIAPKLTKSELAAQKKVIKHLGGEDTLSNIEENMGAAFSAAERALSEIGVHMSALDILGVIDFTKPSYARRFALYYPKSGDETRHLVSHGTNTGRLYAKRFSNRVGSHQSSLGLYKIGKQYNGSHGRSLRLHGLEKGLNSNAHRRAVVLHSAWYVSYKAILKNLRKEGVPRIGRSHGCPAVHNEEASYIIKTLRPGSYLYLYADS